MRSGARLRLKDADVAVFADAEGTGSQRRETEEKEASQQSHDIDGEPVRQYCRIHGDDGQLHIDLEA